MTDEQHIPDELASGTPGDTSPASPPVPEAPPDPTAPPIAPGSMTVTRRASWPMVIGLLIVIVSSMGVLGSLMGAASMWFNAAIFDATVAGSGGAASMASISEVAASFAWPVTIASVFELGVNALGVFAGIGLMNRNPRSVSRVLLWAWLKLVASTARAGVTLMYSVVSTSAMFDDPQMANTPGMTPMFGNAMVAFTVVAAVVFTVFWNWSLPVVSLVWLRRAKAKAEMARWAANPATNQATNPAINSSTGGVTR